MHWMLGMIIGIVIGVGYMAVMWWFESMTRIEDTRKSYKKMESILCDNCKQLIDKPDYLK